MDNPSISEKPAASRDPQTRTPTTFDDAEVVLHVLSPSPEVAGGRITFPRIHLDTTVLQLKTRIAMTMQAGPLPDRQRLIYRGHVLPNPQTNLRQILRPPGSEHLDSYTLHLVLPPGNATAATPSTVQEQSTIRPAPSHMQPVQPRSNTNMTAQQATLLAQVQATQATLENQLNVLANMPHVQLGENGQLATLRAQTQATQMMLENQVNMLQHAVNHNASHANTYHAPGTHQNGTLPNNNVPNAAPFNVVPNGMQVTYQMHGQPMGPFGMPPGTSQGIPVQYHQYLMAQHQHHMAQHQQMPQPGQTGSAGNQPAPNSMQPTMQQTPRTTTDPFIPDQTGGLTTASQTPFPTTTRVHEATGPQGERMRTVIRESGNMTISMNNTTTPTSRPASGPGVAPGSNASAVTGMENRTASELQSLPAPIQHPFQPFRHLPFPFAGPQNHQAAATTASTTAWVVNSPAGPEALVFAPGHGLFSSARQTSARLITPPTSRHRHGTRDTNQANPPNAPGAQRVDAAQPMAQAVVRQDQNPNGQDNPMLIFIVQRAWLFLRLYIFTFFLSEPNTWRRYILLGIATFICMLPRQNPFHELLGAIRRHVDGLIGPYTPAPPQAAQVQGAAQPQNQGGMATVTSTAGIPTPEATAARLLREHEARNPSLFRDMLFRLERGMALFLASLIPGVGERHVRAREDARREHDRLATERREIEERERNQAQTQQGEATAVVNGGEVGSTAVERDGAEQLRERNPALTEETQV